MAENNKIKEITNHIKDLEREFDNLIKSNPYLLYCIDDKSTDIDNKYKKFRKYDRYKTIIFFILGFAFSSITMLLYYFFIKVNPENLIPDSQNHLQIILNFIIKSMPIIITVFSFVILFWVFIIRLFVDKEDFFNEKFIAGLFLCLITALMAFFASITKNELLLFVCPIMSYIIVLFSLSLIYNPLSSRNLKRTIIEKTKLIQEELDALNKSIVQESHSKVLDKIVAVEKTISNGNTDLSKIHSITVLDSLRLELIKNSINGINLVEDWKFLDLAQNMIDEIMTCENTKITILGDLSFLSTEDGLTKLVDTVVNKNKTFQIYFTGEKQNGNNIIKSEHCENLVKIFKNKYCNDTNIQKIKNNITLCPILSESFTGIGFIGLRENSDDENNKRYEKVYAYVSSLLINEKNVDITRINPFVFSWKSNKTDYFKSFLDCKMIFDQQLKVLINNQATESSKLLDCNDNQNNNKSSNRKKK